MENRIMIFGSNGQLGTALSNLFDEEDINYLGLDFPEIDLTKPVTYYDKIISYEPNVLINCSAYTNVNKAESEIEKAMIINGIALHKLVELCNKKKIYLIHISTDYVFSGNKGSFYEEADIPDPVNFYGITKYVGEKIIQLYSNNYVIVRTAALYGESRKNSQNIVKKLISLANKNSTVKLVRDEFTSPTYAANLANQLVLIIENKLQGIIHATSEGSCNWVEFGRYLFNQLKIEVEIEEVESSYFNKMLKKPQESNLINARLKNMNDNIMLSWKTALKHYLHSEII